MNMLDRWRDIAIVREIDGLRNSQIDRAIQEKLHKIDR